MQLRNKLRTKSKANPDLLPKYTKLKHTVKHSISAAKQNFISKCLNNPNTKGVWNVINKLLKPGTNIINHDINLLNKHFINISENSLAKSIPLLKISKLTLFGPLTFLLLAAPLFSTYFLK